MKYLSKNRGTKKRFGALTYRKKSDRPKIKAVLLEDQTLPGIGGRFCAYSESFLKPIDEAHIEHFDPRLKDTQADGYENLYVVLPWMNSHKSKKIQKHLPLLCPFSEERWTRISYDGQIFTWKEGDQEAENLVTFLGWNKPEVVLSRQNHTERILEHLAFYDSKADLVSYLRKRPDRLSFITSLLHHLDIELAELLEPEEKGDHA